jgi:hypothetical protein
MSSPPLTHGKGPRSTIHCLIGGSGTRQCADILPSPRVVRPGRNPVYPADLQPFLVMCWSVIRGTAGKLLAAATPAISSRCCAQSCLLTAIRSQSDQETPQGPRPTSRGWPTAVKANTSKKSDQAANRKRKAPLAHSSVRQRRLQGRQRRRRRLARSAVSKL